MLLSAAPRHYLENDAMRVSGIRAHEGTVGKHRLLTLLLLACFGALSLLPLLPNNPFGWIVTAGAIVITIIVAVGVAAQRRGSDGAETAPSADPISSVKSTSLSDRHHVSRHTLYYHPFFGLPIVIANAALIGTLGWWALIVVLPLDIAVIWLFFWPGIRGG
jgi:hypothetical protein